MAEMQPMEIKNALFSMLAWKYPGPDGFSTRFFKSTWKIIGNSLCRFIQSLWLRESSIFEINFTNMCLIPKISSP